MTVKELAFKYSTEGAKAAQRADEGVRKSVKKTGKVADRESDKVDQWMQRNKRAIQGAAVATLGAATAIISSSSRMNAELSGVRTAFGLLADTIVSDLLPNTGSLTQSAMNIVMAYRDLDSGTRKVISGIAAFVGIIAVLLPVAATLIGSISTIAGVIGGASGLVAAFGTLVSVGGTVVSVVGTILGALASLISLPVLIIAAIAALAAAYIFNIGGMRDKTDAVVGDIIGFLKGLASGALEWGKKTVSNLGSAIANRVNKARDAAADVRDRVKDRITDLVDSAKGWGKSVVNGIINGLTDRLSALKDAAKNVAQTIRDYLPSSPAAKGPLSDLDKVGPGAANTVATGLESGRDRVARGAERFAGGMAGMGTQRGGGGGETRIENVEIIIQSSGNRRRDGQRAAEEVEEEFGRTLGARGA